MNSRLHPQFACYSLCLRVLKSLLHAFRPGVTAALSGRDRAHRVFIPSEPFPVSFKMYVPGTSRQCNPVEH